MAGHETPPEPRIHRAARLGDLAELEWLLAAGDDINSRADLEYDYGPFVRRLTPLMVAARSEDGATAETLRWLLGHGADLRARSEGGVTAAWYAAGDGGRWEVKRGASSPDRAERLRLLLDAGLDPLESAGNGRSLITEACGAGDPARVALLLARGAPAVPRLDPELAGRLAAERDARNRRMFERPGASKDEIDAAVRTYFGEPEGFLGAYQIPLFCAAGSGSAECVRLILAAGAGPDSRDDSDRTPLMLSGSAEAARALIEAGADPGALDGYGDDVLEVVIREGEDDPAVPPAWAGVADVLAEAGADLGRLNKIGRTRLYAAAFGRRAGAVAWLLERGADPRAGAGDGLTPLHAASWQYSPPGGAGAPEAPEARIIGTLIGAGLEVNARDAHGNTPLHVAVSPYSHGPCSSDGPNPAAAAALLGHGADPNLCDQDGLPPLVVAVRGWAVDESGLECVRLLLEAGADSRLRAAGGKTALDYARAVHKKYLHLNENPPEPEPGGDEDRERARANREEALMRAAECVESLRAATEGHGEGRPRLRGGGWRARATRFRGAPARPTIFRLTRGE